MHNPAVGLILMKLISNSETTSSFSTATHCMALLGCLSTKVTLVAINDCQNVTGIGDKVEPSKAKHGHIGSEPSPILKILI